MIDLGQETQPRTVTLEFLRDAGAAKKCTVKASSSLTEAPVKLTEATWDDYQATCRILIPEGKKLRYLRLDFDEPVKEGSISLAIRELDVE